MVTIQDMIDAGGQVATAYCQNPACGHRATVDWSRLRDRLGPDHGALHGDIVPKLVCSKCGGKAVGLIVGADPTKTPSTSAGRNAYRDQKGGR